MAKPKTGKREAGDSVRQEQRWREVVEAWRSSGLTQREFCRREGLGEWTLSGWKCELARRERKRAGVCEPVKEVAPEGPVEWLAVDLEPAHGERGSVPAGVGGWQFEVVLRGERRVRLGSDFDGTGLERLIGVLERLPC